MNEPTTLDEDYRRREAEQIRQSTERVNAREAVSHPYVPDTDTASQEPTK
jgi:hypothetical protein